MQIKVEAETGQRNEMKRKGREKRQCRRRVAFLKKRRHASRPFVLRGGVCVCVCHGSARPTCLNAVLRCRNCRRLRPPPRFRSFRGGSTRTHLLLVNLSEVSVVLNQPPLKVVDAELVGDFRHESYCAMTHNNVIFTARYKFMYMRHWHKIYNE